MPRLALGLAALGRPAYINLGRDSALPTERTVAAMRQTCYAVLDAAYDAGIRHVDAARSYGRAEEFLADWLVRPGHGDVTVSSKWGYEYVGDWRIDAPVHEVKEHSRARFEHQWQESYALLGDRLALYQVHSLTADSPLFDDVALLSALADRRDSGVRLGFSTSGPAQSKAIRRAGGLEVRGARLFDAVQSTWNLLEPSAGAALAEAHADGLQVMVKEALANGRLAVEPPAPLADLARDHATGPDAVALAIAAAQPWADVLLLGAASPQQLAANLRLRQVSLDARTLSDLAEPATYYWKHRATLAWN